jgi:hypothetical protein
MHMDIRADVALRQARRARKLVRRRLRIDAGSVRDGIFGDGTLTVALAVRRESDEAPGLTLDWRSDRPVALVIVRSGTGGQDVAFHVGPALAGSTVAPAADGSGLQYVAFCYDVPIEAEPSTEPSSLAPEPTAMPTTAPAPRRRAGFGIPTRLRPTPFPTGP